ncbi:MAG: hydroxyacid dehydrogenase [Caldilineaceae bacterium]|nr:hydroxyacid dehydrogenase [Caldilineaceae bacterium]
MKSLIVVHAEFEAHWPFVADHWLERWSDQGETELIRLARGDRRTVQEGVVAPQQVTRLACLGVPVDDAEDGACLADFSALREAAFANAYGHGNLSETCRAALRSRGVRVYTQVSEGFWGESVAEFALALTICGLRRIPQLYHEMLADHAAWDRYAPENNQGPGQLGAQFSDDVRFANGTITGKRVRIVGAGNIGSRYASFASMMGAEVAAWDPFAPEPNFHRAGSRREWHLGSLVQDAEIFAPMLPISDSTRGLITASHIDALPTGCLVVLATRAGICDVPALRRRVLADELTLAADVFDIEPLPLGDPLLGRHNVVHTPHIAGRTRDANVQWVERCWCNSSAASREGDGWTRRASVRKSMSMAARRPTLTGLVSTVDRPGPPPPIEVHTPSRP